jgi:uncharacterized membrane protein YdjX (TVP38/TMEM64 family)
MRSSVSPRLTRILAGFVLAIGIFAYWKGGFAYLDLDSLRSVRDSPWTPLLILASMATAWAFALPASIFFFIIPLLYDPFLSAAMMSLGSGLGATTGYVASRFVAGTWIEKFRTHRVTQFLSRHSTFSTLFAIRIVPSSPHGFISYGAGILGIPFTRFVIATMAAILIKGYIYANAVHAAINATSLSDALNWQSVAALFFIGVLAVGGGWVKSRWLQKAFLDP